MLKLDMSEQLASTQNLLVRIKKEINKMHHGPVHSSLYTHYYFL